MQQKYLPVGAMARTHLTLELTLGDQEKIHDASMAWAVKDMEYMAEIIHLDPADGRLGTFGGKGGIVVHSSTYSQHNKTASNGSGSMSMAFFPPYKSLKPLMQYSKRKNRLTMLIHT
jgi:hypothetical protein